MNEYTKGKWEKDWMHFLNCLNFGKSALDADAIRFMNEVPAKIANALQQRDDLLDACKYTIEKLRKVKGKTFPILPILQAIAKAEGK